MIIAFVLWLFFSICVGALAQHFGRSGGGYGLLALLISPLLALAVLLAAGRSRKGIEDNALASGAMRKCPHCAELVRAEATLCRYCRSELPRGIYQP